MSQDIVPTRDESSNSEGEVAFQAGLDQDLANICQKLKDSRGYQVSFTTVNAGAAVVNHVLRRNFPNDIALKVHKECREIIAEQLEA